jgi:hypothetical protein
VEDTGIASFPLGSLQRRTAGASQPSTPTGGISQLGTEPWRPEVIVGINFGLTWCI